MKILNIKQENIGGEKIVVTVEGYPHARPVFDVGLSEAELQIKVDEWAIIQSEIDSINNGTATPEIIEKHKPLPPVKTVSDITEVIEDGENKVLKVKTAIMAENLFTTLLSV